MSAFFKALIGALTGLPKLIDLLDQLYQALGEALYEFKQKKAEKDLKDAIEKAKKEKDTSDLEKSFNPDHK